MQPLSKTFCPAKWDELIINFAHNYVYACCKATPKRFKDGNYQSILEDQKTNLLNGIQDPTCSYCWSIENNSLTSKRHEYLKNFDMTKLESYQKNEVKPQYIELFLGNECNFQCIYCNPKYSSQWVADIAKKKYPIYTDRYVYAIENKNKNILDSNLNFLSTIDDTNIIVSLLGGEPFINKNFWNIIETLQAKELHIVTNLSFASKNTIDRFINETKKFKKIKFNISLDSTHKVTEFVRYGMNFELFVNNLNYIIDKAPENFDIAIVSVMTSLTVKDLENMTAFTHSMKQKRKNLKWILSVCVEPKIQSFSTLHDMHKDKVLKIIQELKTKDYILGIESFESAIKTAKFSKQLYKELQTFLTEFANRKKISLPVEFDLI